MDSIKIFDVKIDSFTVDSLHRTILDAAKSGGQLVITNANVHALNIAVKDKRFRQTYTDADYCFCDGHGVMLAARLLGKKLPEKITYADWLPQLAEFCAANSLSMFLVGGRPGVAAKAAKELTREHKGLKIVGTYHGYFDKAVDSAENREVIDMINSVKPHILIVCFGMPLQEYWIHDNRTRIKTNVILNGGAAFDYIAGELRRPPRWMIRCGLEWLGRMLIEPRRLWKRYIVGNPVFAWNILREYLRRKKV